MKTKDYFCEITTEETAPHFCCSQWGYDELTEADRNMLVIEEKK